MHIIPVIDLLNGVVVHAKQGQRDNYKAIQSQLTHSSKPLDIVAALLNQYPFKSLYIADLNSIQKIPAPNSDHYAVIAGIANAYPEIELWVDAGISDLQSLDKWQALNIKLILGSENFPNHLDYQAIANAMNNRFCLSLDFMRDGFKGHENILANTHEWPDTVIVMSIKQVGSNLGPNMMQLTHIRSKHTTANIIAAGGVRNVEDLIKLKESNIHGALIATALHQQQITAADLAHVIQ